MSRQLWRGLALTFVLTLLPTLAFAVAKVGSFTLPAAGGPQTVGVTGVGFQPKVVLMWSAGLTTEDTFTDASDLIHSFGFSDVTQERGVCVYDQDTADPMITNSILDDDIYIRRVNGTITQAGKIQSFDTDGFTFNLTTHDNIAVIVHYLAVGGVSITGTKIGHAQVPSGTGNQTVSGLGLTPSIVFMLSVGQVGASPPVSGVHAFFGLGAFIAGGGEACFTYSCENALAASDTRSFQNNGDVFQLVGTTATDMVRADSPSFAAGEFTINWEKVSGAPGALYSYLAVEGGSWVVGTRTLAAATGNQDVALGFTPQGALVFGTGDTTQFSTVRDDAVHSLGAGDGTTSKGIWVGSDDGAGVSRVNLRQNSASAIVFSTPVSSGAPANQGEATLAFPTNTLRTTWSTAPTVNDLLFYVAFNTGAAPAVGRRRGVHVY